MRLVNRDDPIEFLPEAQKRIIRDHQAHRYVELGPLFRELGVGIEMTRMPDGLSGEASYAHNCSPSGFLVRVNSQHSMPRKRFTAAHELGHCLLHGAEIRRKAGADNLLGSLNRSADPEFCDLLGDFIMDPFSDQNEHLQEIEANRFAAELLMPAPILNKLWRGGVKGQRGLAKCLGVSSQAIKHRLRDLDATCC